MPRGSVYEAFCLTPGELQGHRTGRPLVAQCERRSARGGCPVLVPNEGRATLHCASASHW